eukprot:COSAG02_NODE_3875_length_6104_cov_4.803331_6_plen_43_part_00
MHRRLYWEQLRGKPGVQIYIVDDYASGGLAYTNGILAALIMC